MPQAARPSESPACPSCDRRSPGKVLFYDTLTRSPSRGVNEVAVGALPDMLTFTHDGRKLLVANEGTPNVSPDAPYGDVDPPETRIDSVIPRNCVEKSDQSPFVPAR